MQKIYKLIVVCFSAIIIALSYDLLVYAYESPENATHNNRVYDVLNGPVLVGDTYTVINPLLRNDGNWQRINGHWYLFRNGNRVTGWARYGSRWYFLDRLSGRMRTGWLQDPQWTWYFLNPPAGQRGHNSSRPEGSMQTGWLEYNNNWYFLNPSSGGAGHRVGAPEGSMLTNWMQRNGNWYFLNPLNNLPNHQNAQLQGSMFSGRHIIDGTQHLFNRSGRWQGGFNAATPARHLGGWTPPAFSGITNINLRFSNSLLNNPTWNTAVSYGLTRWNRYTSTTQVRFQTVATGNLVDIPASNLSIPGALGTMRPINPNGVGNLFGANLRQFQINLYTSTINNLHIPQGAQRTHAITNIMVHELGHVIGLEDGFHGAPLNGGFDNSVMNHQRERTIRAVPTSFDVTSVRMIYE